MTYTTLPSYSKWQSDSSVLFAVRKDDIVLDRIDLLLEHYWSTKDISKNFTTGYWLKIYQTGSKAMEKKRSPPSTRYLPVYARVSTLDQQTLPRQIRALREYAAKRGWLVVSQVNEGGSGAAARQLRQQLMDAAAATRHRRGAGVTFGSTGPVRRRSRFHFAGTH